MSLPSSQFLAGGWSNRPFQIALASYLAVMCSSTTAVLLLAAGVGPSGVLVGVALASGIGTAAGTGFARTVSDLPARLAPSRLRRALLYVPVVPFALLGGAAWFGSSSPARRAALVAAVAGFAVAYMLEALARDRYVETVVGADPIGVWERSPTESPAFYGVLVVAWLGLAVFSALGGNWVGAFIWTSLVALWLGTTVVEGRVRFGSFDPTIELRVHESGLVVSRPYIKRLVRWNDIEQVVVREDQLILDKGLFDVRFDRADVEDLEGLYETIERTRQTAI